MLTKMPTVVAVAAIACAALGDGTAKQMSKLERVYNEKFGGQLERPTALKGVIGFVDCASGMAEADIERVRDTIAKEMKFNYRIVKSGAIDGLPSRKDVDGFGLSVAVFIVAAPSLPSMLSAPEERWSLVNVQRLKEGLPDNIVGSRLFSARCRGEIMRALALACGSWTSQYAGNILTVSSVAGLDSVDPDKVVFDIVQRCTKHLESIGVTPSRKATYQVACREGWAPAPTNDVQRAIWNEVRKLPEKPIQIKFDPKKGR